MSGATPCEHKRWDRFLRRCADCKRTKKQIVRGDEGPPEPIDELAIRRMVRPLLRGTR